MKWNGGLSCELEVGEFFRINSNVRSSPWEYDTSENILAGSICLQVNRTRPIPWISFSETIWKDEIDALSPLDGPVRWLGDVCGGGPLFYLLRGHGTAPT
jgi:hypothetical protein